MRFVFCFGVILHRSSMGKGLLIRSIGGFNPLKPHTLLPGGVEDVAIDCSAEGAAGRRRDNCNSNCFA